MRGIRQSGSEGGAAVTHHPYPYVSLPRSGAAPTGLDRVLRRSVFYNHAAPLALHTAGRHAEERSCCVCPNPEGCQSSATPPERGQNVVNKLLKRVLDDRVVVKLPF
jgi:hypothetical protein